MKNLFFFSHGSITSHHVRVDLDGNDENSIEHDDANGNELFCKYIEKLTLDS